MTNIGNLPNEAELQALAGGMGDLWKDVPEPADMLKGLGFESWQPLAEMWDLPEPADMLKTVGFESWQAREEMWAVPGPADMLKTLGFESWQALADLWKDLPEPADMLRTLGLESERVPQEQLAAASDQGRIKGDWLGHGPMESDGSDTAGSSTVAGVDLRTGIAGFTAREFAVLLVVLAAFAVAAEKQVAEAAASALATVGGRLKALGYLNRDSDLASTLTLVLPWIFALSMVLDRGGRSEHCPDAVDCPPGES